MTTLMRLGLVVALCVCAPAGAQTPSRTTLMLSLKTMGKALAECRRSYTWVQPGTSVPPIKLVVGKTDYDKDMESLDIAEEFTNFLIDHPEQITGKALVAVISSSADFSVGVGSTRTAIVQSLTRQDRKSNASMVEPLVATSAYLDECQRSIFSASDDYVGLVLNFVGIEDEIIATRSSTAAAHRRD